jgi:acyl carrier protein
MTLERSTEALLGLIGAGFRAVAGRPPVRLELEDDVRAVDLDSIQVLELVVWLEDTLGVEVTFERMAEVVTVHDLITALQEGLGRGRRRPQF